MKAKLLFVALFVFSCQQTFSQAPNWAWEKGCGGTGWDECHSITVDEDGSVYSTGSFFGTVDFDPGPGTFNLTSAGVEDIFITRMDASGNLVWVKTIGGTSDEVGNSIAVDVSGNVYITGNFDGTVDFDPGAGTTNLSPAGSYDAFILKLNPAGDFVWAKAVGGALGDMGANISVDADNNVYTTGSFGGTVDFDPGPGTNYLTSIPSCSFICKLDSAGNFLWAKRLDGTINVLGRTTAFDVHGNVYNVGFFQGTVDFDPGPGTFSITSSGLDDVFISKLDTAGNFAWAKTMGGAAYDDGFAISVDDSGNIYTTGSFSGTGDFDPGPAVYNLTGNSNAFISKLDSSGNFVWAKAFTGNASYAFAAPVDPSGSVYVTGSFNGTTDFDPDTSLSFNLSSSGNADIFICKLSSSGDFIWVKEVGGAGDDNTRSAVVDTAGNYYLSGYFSSQQITFDSNVLLNTDNSGNTADIFIARLDKITTQTENIKNTDNVFVFPNPASDYLTIQANHQKSEVTITNLTGKIIYSTTSTASQIEINTKNFSDGIYFVRVQTDDFVETKKVVIAH